jgi:tRNA-specific 2-thiouridylase
VHVDGRVLGRHAGIINFTVGQRRGIGIADAQGGGEPLYVVRLDAARKRVVVGPKPALAIAGMSLREVNWLGGAPAGGGGLGVTVKVRSTTPAVAATVFVAGEGARVVFAEPQYGVAPGQACVFYAGDRVLGGGWIARAEAATAVA